MIRTTIAAVMIAAFATNAMAHSKTKRSTPADKATVDTVDLIAIRFNDPMRVTAITLTGPHGALDVERETGLEPVTEFFAKPSELMPVGDYTVDWRGLSADGHPMQGSFGFTVTD